MELEINEPETLGDYLKICRAMGFDKAAKFFEKKIAESDENDRVIQPSSQMLYLIASIERGNDS